jgi:hypothetical protein
MRCLSVAPGGNESGNTGRPEAPGETPPPPFRQGHRHPGLTATPHPHARYPRKRPRARSSVASSGPRVERPTGP